MKQEMNWVRVSRTVSLLSLIVLACFGTARAVPPPLTYQGSLTDAGSPADGMYEMQFSLFGSLAGNDQIGSTLTHSPVTVANGVFTVQLDFSPATPFTTGADRWLEIAVRKAGGPPGFTTLSPRQQITSSPYAIRTLSAQQADALSSACVGCVNDSNVSDTLTIGATSTVSDSALSAQVARLNGAQTITGDWVNTANPWADNEVADTLTIGPSSTVSDSALSAQVAHLDAAETIAGDWVNTANPWSDNEVSDALTLNGGTVNNTVIGGTTSAAGTFTTLALNGGGGTNAGLSKSGIDRSSALPEVFNIQNSGAGTITLQVDGANVITTTNETFVNTTGDTMSGPLNMNNNTIQGTTSAIDFANFDVSSTGNVTAAAGTFTSLNANSLDRSAAGTLTIGSPTATAVTITPSTTISSTLTVNGSTTLGDANTDTVTINAGPVNMPNATSASDGLILGGDVHLYRSAGNTLSIPDFLVIGSLTTTNGPITTVTRTVTSDTTITAFDSVLFVDANLVANVNLPAAGASTIGRVYYVYITNGSGLPISANGSNTINGSGVIVVSGQFSGVRIIGASATGWIATRLVAED